MRERKLLPTDFLTIWATAGAKPELFRSVESFSLLIPSSVAASRTSESSYHIGRRLARGPAEEGILVDTGTVNLRKSPGAFVGA